MPRLIDGVDLKLRDGREYRLPPLDVRTLRKFSKDGRLATAMSIKRGGLPSGEQLDAVVSLLLAGFQANYPDLSEDEVEGLLDMGNLVPVMEALFAATGYKDGLTPGEAPAP
jgi:hypothetical protein